MMLRECVHGEEILHRELQFGVLSARAFLYGLRGERLS